RPRTGHVETIRRMAAPRATLLAAVVVALSAATLPGQTVAPGGDPSVSVSAPRAFQVQSLPLSPFSVIPDAVQSAGFRSSAVVSTGAPALGQVQRMPSGDSPPGGPSAWLAAPPESSVPAAPQPAAAPGFIFGHGPGPVMSYPHVTATAPAWRWHGY